MSGSGNGVDIGAVHQLLLKVAEMVGAQARVLEDHTSLLNEHTRVLNEHSRILNDHTHVLNEHTLILHDHGGRLADMESGQASLRQEVAQYHASVMGHGILISELDHRVRWIEEHLNLPSTT